MQRRNSLEDTKRLGLRIDADLHRKLRLISVNEDISLNFLLEEILREYADNYSGSLSL